MRQRDYLVEDLLTDSASAGVRLRGSVHVEAAPGDPLDEIEWLATVRAATGLPSVAVAALDLGADDADDALDVLASREIVRGVREIVAWHADQHATFAAVPDLTDQPRWRQRYARLGDMGLSFDLQLYPSQLGAAGRLADAEPEVALAIVHTASPLFGDDADRSVWASGLGALAERPNTVLKISGLGMFFHSDAVRPEAFDVVARAVDTFGPDRVMFGSNFPVDGINRTYAETYALFDEATAGFDRREREAMFAGNAARFYRIS